VKELGLKRSKQQHQPEVHSQIALARQNFIAALHSSDTEMLYERDQPFCRLHFDREKFQNMFPSFPTKFLWS